MFLPSQPAHKHMYKCHGESRKVFRNVSSPCDLDIAGLLVKYVGDPQFGGLSNVLDDRIRIQKDLNRENWWAAIQKIKCNRDKCKFLYVGSKKEKRVSFLSYSYPIHLPCCSLGDVFKTQIWSCHFLAENPLTESYCPEDKDKTHYVVFEIFLRPLLFSSSLSPVSLSCWALQLYRRPLGSTVLGLSRFLYPNTTFTLPCMAPGLKDIRKTIHKGLVFVTYLKGFLIILLSFNK